MSLPANCPRNLDSILNLPVMLTVELGSCLKSTRALMGLDVGSVVNLDGRVGGQVHIYAEEKFVARGEVVVVDESIAIKITEIAGQ